MSTAVAVSVVASHGIAADPEDVMPHDHARKAALRRLKTAYGAKHHKARALLAEPAERREDLCELLDCGEADNVTEAVAILDDPRNELLCEECGWTMGMVCPECPGCGCYAGCCTGWRHTEYAHPDDRKPEPNPCAPACDCGNPGSGEQR